MDVICDPHSNVWLNAVKNGKSQKMNQEFCQCNTAVAPAAQFHLTSWTFFLEGCHPPFFSLSPVRRQVQVNLYRDLQAVQLGNKNTVSWADPKHLQSIRPTSWRSRGSALQKQLCFLVRWLQKSAGVKTPTFFILFYGFKGRFQLRIDLSFILFLLDCRLVSKTSRS